MAAAWSEKPVLEGGVRRGLTVSCIKWAIPSLIFAFTLSCHMQSNDTRSELLHWEKDFEKAVVSNDVDAIGKFLADDSQGMYAYICKRCAHRHEWEGASSGSSLDG